MTLRPENLLWLKGQAAATDKGSVSEVVDILVTDARLKGRPATVKSVAGTIDLREDDDLQWSDAYVENLFDRSLQRPMLVRERPPASKKTRRG